MNATRLIDPAQPPVSEDEIKAFLRVDHNDEDGLILDILDASVEAVEDQVGRALITQEWQETHPSITDTGVTLRWGPLQELDGVQSWNTSSYEWDDEDLDDYYVIDESVYAKSSWPAGPVRIRYTAGFGDTRLTVPFSIRQAILMLSAHFYEERGLLAAPGRTLKLPYAVEYLISRNRKYF